MAARSQPDRTDEGLSVETVEWEDLWDEDAPGPTIDWQPGQHWTILGPTGIGKTSTLVDLGERSPHHAILVITKNRDDLIHRLPAERDWTVCRTLEQVQRQLKPTWDDWWNRRSRRPKQLIVYHPDVSDHLTNRSDALRSHLGELMNWVYYNGYDHGGITFEIDEATGASQQLGLQKELTLMWDESRSNMVEMCAAIQRPAHVPKSSYNAARYLMVFGAYNDPDDILALSKMAGYGNRRQIREELARLPEHHHLLINTRDGWVVRSRVVIRKRRSNPRGQK